jgi:hypothetical protein
MSDFVTSLIRTYVPIGVGAVVSYLVTKGIEIDANAQLGLVTFLTAVLQGAYYLVARLLERKVPSVGGLLLGSSKKPEYAEVK